MPQKPLSVPLFSQNLTTVILCYQAVQINFLTNCSRSKILHQDLSSKLGSKTTSNPFFKNSTGYQFTQESSTTILSLKLTHSICVNFWLFTIHPDNFALSQTQKPSALLSQKQKLLENELFLSQARNNGTHCHMMSVTHHPYFLLRKYRRLIFSNLHMSKHTPLPHVCVCVCVCVCVHMYLCMCLYFFFFLPVNVLVCMEMNICNT